MKYRIRKKPAGPYYASEYLYIVEYKKWWWLYWKTHSKEASEGAAIDELEQERIHKMDGEVIYEKS